MNMPSPPQRLLTLWILGIVASMALVSLTSTDTILAASDRSENANHFGEGASNLGGDMGDHASDPSGDGVGKTDDGSSDDGNPDNDDGVAKHDPRSGIGNVLNAWTSRRSSGQWRPSVFLTNDDST